MLTWQGAPPRVGQCFMLIAPGAFGSSEYYQRLETLIAHIERQDGTRLPGARRLEHRAKAEVEGIQVNATLLDELAARLK